MFIPNEKAILIRFYLEVEITIRVGSCYTFLSNYSEPSCLYSLARICSPLYTFSWWDCLFELQMWKFAAFVLTMMMIARVSNISAGRLLKVDAAASSKHKHLEYGDESYDDDEEEEEEEKEDESSEEEKPHTYKYPRTAVAIVKPSKRRLNYL